MNQDFKKIVLSWVTSSCKLTPKLIKKYETPLREKNFDKVLKTINYSNNPDRISLHIGLNLQFNTCLWILEDCARNIDSSPYDIASYKKGIDKFNQLRNNEIEILNDLIIEKYFPKMNTDTPLFSETPGSILDRINIGFLKKYHYKKVTKDSTECTETINLSTLRVSIIDKQLTDLTDSLTYLLTSSINGSMHFKIYRQFKMYNDVRFKPGNNVGLSIKNSNDK